MGRLCKAHGGQAQCWAQRQESSYCGGAWCSFPPANWAEWRATVFFWAPTMKWGITVANVSDFSKPPELLSYPQQVGECPAW